MHEQFVYDEDGNLLTPNFYDYHVPHALDMPPLKTGYVESPSPFTPLGTKGMGEGGGAGIHAVCAAVQDALRAHGGAIVVDSANPYHRSGRCSSTPSARAPRSRRWTHERLRRAHVRSAARRRCGTCSTTRRRWRRRCRASRASTSTTSSRWTANVKIPLGLGGLKMKIDMDKTEEREPEFARLQIKGQGVGAMLSMETSFELQRRRRRHRRCTGPPT